MSSGYNSWLSNDTQSSNSSDAGYLVSENMSSLNDSQVAFLQRKTMNGRERHIRKKLIYRIEKYLEYKSTNPELTEAQLKDLLDQEFETSIQYEDIYPMRRVSTNINAEPQLGVVVLDNLDPSQLYVYDPKISMVRQSDVVSAEIFSIILRSESTSVLLDEDQSITKYVWKSIPMFQHSNATTGERHYFFYLPIHNNSLLSTPLFSLEASQDMFIMYNSRGSRIFKLSTDLL